MLDLDALHTALTGTLVTPGDGDWDAARQAWNLAVDQHPVAVVQASAPADVAAAVDTAHERGLRLAVQATGHGAAPMGPLDGTLLVKTDRMRGFEIDAAARVARVQAGALWGDVAAAAGASGLAALHGTSIDVGVVGYTLCGGIGWLSRRHGLASSRVRAIELVTADGQQRRVDAEHEPELFWALRGGGGSFGAVTAMEFELLPLAEVFAGALVWPAEASNDVLHAYREWARAAPDEVSSTIRFLRLPPLPDVPELLRDRPVIDVCVAFCGDAAAGDDLIHPLRQAAPTLMDSCGIVPAADLCRLHGDPEQPVPGIGRHALLRELPPEALDALEDVAGARSGSPLLAVELRQLGGALGRSDPAGGALSRVEGEYVLYGVGSPMTPQLGAAVRERLAMVVEAVAPWTIGGTYLNFADQPGGDSADAFDDVTYGRLRAVKARFDPQDLFRANHPIPPAAQPGSR